jgi:hypothetical protein
MEAPPGGGRAGGAFVWEGDMARARKPELITIPVEELSPDERARVTADWWERITGGLRRNPYHCVNWARCGDWSLLCIYIQTGGDINAPPTRKFFADLVRRKVKGPLKYGPALKSLHGGQRASFVAVAMRDLDLNKTAAVRMIAEKYQVSDKTIWNDIKTWWPELSSGGWSVWAPGDDYLTSYPS